MGADRAVAKCVVSESAGVERARHCLQHNWHTYQMLALPSTRDGEGRAAVRVTERDRERMLRPLKRDAGAGLC